ncbi:unnamed protein product, partial [Phaeothamnion confervicola]
EVHSCTSIEPSPLDRRSTNCSLASKLGRKITRESQTRNSKFPWRRHPQMTTKKPLSRGQLSVLSFLKRPVAEEEVASVPVARKGAKPASQSSPQSATAAHGAEEAAFRTPIAGDTPGLKVASEHAVNSKSNEGGNGDRTAGSISDGATSAAGSFGGDDSINRDGRSARIGNSFAESDSESGSESGGESGGESDDGESAFSEDAGDDTNGREGDITAYEAIRLANIRRNKMMLASLGLDAVPKPAPALAPKRRRQSKAERASALAARMAAAGSQRRSKRLEKRPKDTIYSDDNPRIISSEASAIGATGGSSAAAGGGQGYEPPQLMEADYDDSGVLKYVCNGGGRNSGGCDRSVDGLAAGAAAATASAAAGAVAAESSASVKGLKVVMRSPLAAARLSQVYTMDFNAGGRLLAAGGKGGIVAIFAADGNDGGDSSGGGGCAGSSVGGSSSGSVSSSSSGNSSSSSNGSSIENNSSRAPLLSFKAHGGWISGVQFLEDSGGVGGGGACRLVTAANDGIVKLWDAVVHHSGTPRLLATARDLHTKGIFSMHVAANSGASGVATYGGGGFLLATGSKDRTVALSRITAGGIRREQFLGAAGIRGGDDDAHAGIVKDVRFRDAATLASCGDDVWDLRVAGAAPAVAWAAAHTGGTHTVRWHPSDGNLLLTAGLDPVVRCWDLRRSSGPVREYRGHVPFVLLRHKTIHRPEFVVGGDAFVTCGERSHQLSMFRTGIVGGDGAPESGSGGSGGAAGGTMCSQGDVGGELTAIAVHG